MACKKILAGLSISLLFFILCLKSYGQSVTSQYFEERRRKSALEDDKKSRLQREQQKKNVSPGNPINSNETLTSTQQEEIWARERQKETSIQLEKKVSITQYLMRPPAPEEVSQQVIFIRKITIAKTPPGRHY